MPHTNRERKAHDEFLTGNWWSPLNGSPPITNMLMYTVVRAAAARVTLDTFSCFCHLRAKKGGER